jgi:hypothetical protein
MTPTKSKTKSTLTAAFIFGLIIIPVLSIQYLDVSIPAYGQNDFPPFEIGDIIGPNESTSQVTNNSSDTLGNFSPDTETDDCVMPPCPPGHACIQSCP